MNQKIRAILGSRVHFLVKVFTIIAFAFFTKLLISCRPVPPIEMNYNHICIEGIDNRDKNMYWYSSVDEMLFSAVAFKLTIADTTDYYLCDLNTNSALNSLSFTPAVAFWFIDTYISLTKVEQIKVTTLLDIDENIKSGDDITNLIVYDIENYQGIYSNMSDAISKLNGVQQGGPSGAIVLALKIPVLNSKAQFNVQVTLTNGDVLSTNSQIFNIITQ